MKAKGAISCGWAARSLGCPSAAIIEIEPRGSVSTYTATAVHGDSDFRNRHEEMGFGTGWSKTFDQLQEVMRPAPQQG